MTEQTTESHEVEAETEAGEPITAGVDIQTDGMVMELSANPAAPAEAAAATIDPADETPTEPGETGDDPPAADSTQARRAELDAMTVKDLQVVCRNLGLKVSGAKEDLVARLLADQTGETPPPAAVEYAFPTRSRCPRCGVTDTKATSTKGEVQYRQCQRAVCRYRYAVRGKRI